MFGHSNISNQIVHINGYLQAWLDDPGVSLLIKIYMYIHTYIDLKPSEFSIILYIYNYLCCI